MCIKFSCLSAIAALAFSAASIAAPFQSWDAGYSFRMNEPGVIGPAASDTDEDEDSDGIWVQFLKDHDQPVPDDWSTARILIQEQGIVQIPEAPYPATKLDGIAMIGQSYARVDPSKDAQVMLAVYHPGQNRELQNVNYVGSTGHNVDGLLPVTQAGEIVFIHQGLSDISGLSNLKKVSHDLAINQNVLTNVNGLKNLKSVGGSLNLPENRLQNMSGLSNLETVGQDLILANNALGAVGNGLPMLRHVGGTLSLARSGLTEFNGANNLQTVGSLSFTYNKNLSSIKGFTNLTSIGDTLAFNNDRSLTNVDAFGNLQSVQIVDISSTGITNLDWLAGTSPKQVNAPGAALGDISGLQDITQMQYLGLYGNNLTNVDALSSLTKIESLDLRSNPITDITGLSSLTTANQLLLSAGHLKHVDGLSHLARVNTLHLAYNDLRDVDGLGNLAEVQNLTLQANPNLTDLSGLSHINTFEGYARNVQIDTDIASRPGFVPIQGGRLCDSANTDVFRGASQESVCATVTHDPNYDPLAGYEDNQKL